MHYYRFIDFIYVLQNSTLAIHVQGIEMFENVQNTFKMFKGSNYSLYILFFLFLI